MPTSADLLLDTSTAVGLVVVGSDAHEAIIERTEGLTLGLAGHAAFETFSVLTRLPGGRRLSARAAARVIATNFPAEHHLDRTTAAKALDELSSAGVAGGSVYDGLVALAARDAGVLLLSNDRRAAKTYAALGVAVELL